MRYYYTIDSISDMYESYNIWDDVENKHIGVIEDEDMAKKIVDMLNEKDFIVDK